MNNAVEVRMQVQALLGVRVDGDIGKESKEAFEQLAEADPRAPWPPIGGPAFQGQFTTALRDEYKRLHSEMHLREEWADRIKATGDRIAANEQRYAKLADALCRRGNHHGPFDWRFIGIVHALECGLSFEQHLHNGDPLTSRTVQVPRGRPANGAPPFTWEESALDALVMKGLHTETDWSVPRMLYHFERYNGFGYRRYHPEVLSPYLWSGTTHYRLGKYAADGVWDPELVSKQVGAAALLSYLNQLHDRT